jgi:hypothetical protein
MQKVHLHCGLESQAICKNVTACESSPLARIMQDICIAKGNANQTVYMLEPRLAK